jgi:hypothetical protein
MLLLPSALSAVLVDALSAVLTRIARAWIGVWCLGGSDNNLRLTVLASETSWALALNHDE